MSQKPQLTIRAVRDEPIVYQCSHCGRQFPLAEDVPPKDAAAKLLREFKEHVQQVHTDSGL
jgi:hypothetical protein